MQVDLEAIRPGTNLVAVKRVSHESGWIHLCFVLVEEAEYYEHR